MDYLLAIILPPVAVLNLILTLCFWVPGVIHAILVLNNAPADKRNKQVIKAMNKQNRR